MKGFRMLFVSVALGLLSLSTLAQGSASVVKVSPGESVYKIKRGGAVQVEVVIKVGEGYHINSNRPLEKYLIATTLKIDRSPGLTVTPVVYPKAKLEKFEFSKKPLSVFEGKAVLKLTARALSSLAPGAQSLKGKLMVQACNNQQCLRPQSIDVNVPLQVE